MLPMNKRMVMALGVMALATVIVGAGCRRGGTPAAVPASPPPEGSGPSGGRGVLAEATPGVSFRLSDADPSAPSAGAEVPVAPATPLPDEAVEALLARLPELPAGVAEEAAFALRPGPRPPAISGDAIQQPFPPPTTAAASPGTSAGPLAVSRYAPEGEVPIAPQLAVTFSQPMVPLTSHAALAAAEVPVRLDPQPEGRWRWVGTRTLLFEPSDGRFPMATSYTVEVPAGTKSATGGTLAQAVSWTLRTPPPTMVQSHPQGGPVERQPVLFILFDQQVDAEAVSAHVTLEADGDAVDLRLATEADLQADEAVRRLVEDAAPGRWVALRPVEPLPGGAKATVTLRPSLPSAEGLLTTTEPQRFDFQVYGPLQAVELACYGPEPRHVGERGGTIERCEPLAPWSIRFSNPLDLSAFEPEAVTVEPELPGLRVEAYGDQLVVTGASKGRATYTVSLPADLRDVFGQTLGRETAVRFETGNASPALMAPGDAMVVLDPASGPSFIVSSINNDALKVTLYRPEPADWPAFAEVAGSFYRPPEERPAPGTQVWSGTVEPGGEADALTAVPIDLSPALTDGLGQVVAVVAPAQWSPEDENWRNRPVARWIQVTNLGLDAFADSTSMQVWVNSLRDGRPIVDADVSTAPGTGSATTTGDGLATLPAPPAPDPSQPYPPPLLVARADGDVALLPGDFIGWRDATADQPTLSWTVFDDRGIYKPGEEVHVKGWLRRYGPGKGGDVQPLGVDGSTIRYTLVASNGEEVARGTLPVNAFGGFDGAITLPREIELGQASLNLVAEGAGLPASGREHYWGVNVAEFRRPEFEVTATAEQPTYFLGQQGIVTAAASYFAGGALPNAEVTWTVYGEPTTFTPPGQDDFHFGIWRPWFFYDFGPPMPPSQPQSHIGRTDATGRHRLAIDFDGVEPLSAASFRTEATVMDVNRQAWTGSTSLLVHPASHYVGLRAGEWFVQPDTPIEIEAIVADLDGQLVAGSPIAMTAERLETAFRNGEYVEEPVPAGECSVESAAEPVTCRFELTAGGTYRITADVIDPAGRPNRSQLTVWVAGGQAPPSRDLQQQRVQLIPNQDEYAPGDTAEILVQAPFTPAEGLLTIRRSGLVRSEPFHMDDRSTTLRVPIEEAHIPNVTVQVDLVGQTPYPGAEQDPSGTDLPKRPAFASGALDLPVPPAVRTLQVEAAPRSAALKPGEKTAVDVIVRDANGAPVPNAEVALVVADEAVLGLTGYTIPDPLAAFYPQRSPGVSDGHSRALVQLAEASALEGALQGQLAEGRGAGGMPMAAAANGESAALGMAMEKADQTGAPTLATPPPPAPTTGGGGGPEVTVVAERTDFNPLAAFLPALVTDADGRVSAEVKLPDNVTRYRVTAVATDGAKRFGLGEAALTARLPLVVRPSAPRFLNFGDQLELPIVVQNQTEQSQAVDVVVRAQNLALTEGAGRRVTVPAGDRVEVRFPAQAQLPGTAAIQAGVFTSTETDAQRAQLPVWTPATTEAFATYGELDGGAVAQPVARPSDVVEQFGGLELTTWSTAVNQLTDAFLYLQSYPYEGAEQIASRLLATVALKDVLAAFEVEELPSSTEVDAAVRRDLEKLAALQAGDGGFGWWRPDEESNPFVTVHAAHALARAKEKGYAVDEDVLARVQAYLTDIDAHLPDPPYSPEVRRTLKAYALYVRALLGDSDRAAARALFDGSREHTVEELGWILAVLSGDPASERRVAEIRRQLANRASEEAGTAQFATDYQEEHGNLILASDRRADAIVLDALMTDQPQNDLIPKLVRGLLAHRVKGRWASTQENAFVLLALDRYFRTYEAQTPDLVARAWLGDGFIGESRFTGRTADRSEVKVPLSFLPDEGTENVILAKDGPGRLYYRLGLRYAPADLALAPAEHGFSVERTYEAVDNPDDVRRTADGTWQIKPGSRVRVKLTLVADGRRTHVALVDPLPAGLEAQNAELAVTGTIPPEESPEDGDVDARPIPWWWFGPWYSHEAFRDERVEVFSNLLDGGVYTYSYLARATTPGTFVVPPPKAEELYQPETFGRGATDRVEVR
jgi:hypothetical protein